MNVFGFWHDLSQIPAYLQLCIQTWKKHARHAGCQIVLLDFSTLGQWIDISQPLFMALKHGKFSLPQMSDCIRIEIMRKHGGLWMDLDTIVLSEEAFSELPASTDIQNQMFGDLEQHKISASFMKCRKGSKMAEKLAQQQLAKALKNINRHSCPKWDIFANSIIDPYVLSHADEFIMSSMKNAWFECWLSDSYEDRQTKYRDVWFSKSLHASDLPDSPVILLHNSWTPEIFKTMSREQVLSQSCTMSNVLREIDSRA